MLRLVIDISDSDSAPVRYNVDRVALAGAWIRTPPRWIGNVLEDRRIVAGPSVDWANGKVILGRSVSGRLEIVLPIIYDAWEISIPGVYLEQGRRSYAAKVLGISSLLREPAELDIEDETDGNPDAAECQPCGKPRNPLDGPLVDGGGTVTGDPDECYGQLDWEELSSCSGNQVNSGTTYTPGSCPEGKSGRTSYRRERRYVPETDPEYLMDESKYAADCCNKPVADGCIPPCRKIRSTWQGQQWPDVEAALRAKYGDETKIIYLSPKDGPCGTRTDEFRSSRRCSCPDGTGFAVNYIDNQVLIKHGNAVVLNSGFRSPSDPPLDFYKITKPGYYTIELYNIRREDGNLGPCGVDYKFFVAGEEIADESFRGSEYDGLMYSKTFECLLGA
jgi:hypothetical protein